MSTLLCNCPGASALAAVVIEACKEKVGQVQKVVFQRKFASAGTLNEVTVATDDPALQATWDTLKAASDSTKVVASPYLSEPVSEAGAKREYGGGNATIGGIPIILGREPQPFEAKFLDTSQKSIKDLKTFQCETELAVYLIDEHGRIIGLSDDIDSPTKFRPIPIQGLFVGDKSLGGYESPDMNAMEFKFFGNWSDDLSIVTPTDFNALSYF